MLEEIIFVVGAEGALLFGFGILGAVCDLIFAHCKWLDDWIDTLPLMQKDENFY